MNHFVMQICAICPPLEKYQWPLFCEHIICFRPVKVHWRSRLACCEKCEENNESAWGTDHTWIFSSGKNFGSFRRRITWRCVRQASTRGGRWTRWWRPYLPSTWTSRPAARGSTGRSRDMADHWSGRRMNSITLLIYRYVVNSRTLKRNGDDS